MRCRKVRSFLSAYCRDELEGRQRRQVSDHLLACRSCRTQETFYSSLSTASTEISSLKVSNDFNQKLLQRVAKERFAETRTKAFLAREAPLVMWRKVVPVAATACVAVLAFIATMSPVFDSGTPEYANINNQTGEDYMTVQPTANPNLAVQLKDDWSLENQLAKAERFHRISNSVIPASGFTQPGYSGGLNSLTSSGKRPAPFVANYFRVRPVVRIYVVPQPSTVKEGSHAY
ncbi:MAG: zf-HC2 domain-containing protein [candidate division Zixibacteria bacterium]|nr:zf-HC2 domain-containing protein [candidate division Zixibacteria bacterium]MDH3937157.1 zf-HC2 domain-containing protein [candidate division Zixibacteria bacterium]MDH4035189.1 zf-HC2 domain-containing protein [candidate division Zixibacteria bacterium]